MKYNHQRILAVLSAVMIVLTLVLTFNPQLFQGSIFDDILGFVDGGDSDVELASTPGDVPEAEGGDGFINGDPCGFLMGTSDVSSGSEDVVDGQFIMDVIDDVDQACVAASGFSFENSLRESLVRHTTLGYIDFTWSTDPDNHVYVDPATGYWSGVARRRGAGLAPAERWMELDWDCPDEYTEGECDVFRAKTDTSTGEVSGYGWIPALGFTDLTGLTMELPPRRIVAYVEVISDEDVYPGEATIKNAPLSDGYEYWRIELTFVDILTGNILTEADIDTLVMDLTSDFKVFVNQVVNSGDAIQETAFSYGEGCNKTDPYCYMEEYGNGSFNLFVYSAGPTSNMLGMDDDYDEAIESDTDRDGCKWIYESQWPAGSAPECTGIGFFGSDYQKEDVYHVREDDRNYYTLEELSILITFAGDYSDAELFKGGRFSLDGAGEVSEGGPYIYSFGADGSAETELSFRPRFQTQKFVASYDGYEYTSISTDKDQKMQLVTNSTIADFSEEYREHKGGAPVDLGVFHQVEAESDASDAMASDLFLLIDTDEVYNGSTDGSYADVIDDYDRADVISNGGEATFNEDFVMGYGQTCDPCGASPSNTLSNPTAEQWACDSVVAGHTVFEFGARSCYFTAYLPILDPHDDPEAMLIIGSLNSTVEIEGFLDGAGVDDEYYSVLGSVNVATLRDKMYAQIARYTLGQSAEGGDLDLSNIEYATSVVSLMGGRLLYAEDDVTVTGGEDTFSDPITLVVRGGNVYLDESVTGGRLGIVVLENNGAGGNLYVNADVTDIYANIFLDGSMFSQGASYDGDLLPTWASNELRVETLANQLYLKGSLMSRNTLGGSDDDLYPKGDGTYADDYTEAIEYDLNTLRQYRLCCPTDPSTGVPDCSGASGDSEPCEEGESLSEYLDEDGNEVYSSFIVEYEPAGDLPIFTVESGLFN